jgi:hypothetical protein
VGWIGQGSLGTEGNMLNRGDLVKKTRQGISENATNLFGLLRLNGTIAKVELLQLRGVKPMDTYR